VYCNNPGGSDRSTSPRTQVVRLPSAPTLTQFIAPLGFRSASSWAPKKDAVRFGGDEVLPNFIQTRGEVEDEVQRSSLGHLNLISL
jgi:hypothetical protein